MTKKRNSCEEGGVLHILRFLMASCMPDTEIKALQSFKEKKISFDSQGP